MKFRKAVEADIPSIMTIIKQAQMYLRGQGIDQWQNNYPNLETIKNDIHNKNAYVLLKDTIVVGTVVVIFGREKNYESIYQGQWMSNQQYSAIHRIAVDVQQKGTGLSSIMIKHIEEISLNKGVHSIKVDTHKDNKAMQRILHKNGFQYCGIIYLEDNSERMAFEKIL